MWHGNFTIIIIIVILKTTKTKQSRTQNKRKQNEWMDDNTWIDKYLLIGMEPHADFSLSNFLDNQLFGKLKSLMIIIKLLLT